MSHRVGQKGQVVIEKWIRDRLGVRPGWQAVQVLVDNHVEIYFIPPEHRRSLMGSIAPFVRTWPSPDETWDEIRDRAWRTVLRESRHGQHSDADASQ